MGNIRYYTEAEKKLIFENYKTLTKPQMKKLIFEKIGIERTVASIKAFYHTNNLKSGIKTTFYKGMVSTFKGKKFSPEAYAKVSKTFFKKGQRPHNALPVGSRVKVTDTRQSAPYSYWLIKVAEPREWMTLNRYLYEQAYGKLPADVVVVNLDGNCDNHDLSNLRAVSRNELMEATRNGKIYNLSPEETNVLLDCAQLIVKARECEGR